MNRLSLAQRVGLLDLSSYPHEQSRHFRTPHADYRRNLRWRSILHSAVTLQITVDEAVAELIAEAVAEAVAELIAEAVEEAVKEAVAELIAEAVEEAVEEGFQSLRVRWLMRRKQLL